MLSLPWLTESAWSRPSETGLAAIFQQCNADTHIAQISQGLFIDNQREVLPWYTSSPDFNSNEQNERLLDQHVEGMRQHLNLRKQIPAEGCNGWRIAQNWMGRYQTSLFMHELTAVIHANGRHSHCELLSSDLILGCGYISLLLPN